jgi:hypothetical protein
MHMKILYNQRQAELLEGDSRIFEGAEDSDDELFEDAVESEHSEYIISIARGGEKRNYFESRYNLSKELGIISVDIRKKTSSTIPSDISTNRKNQLSHPQIGDTIYIKNVKNPKKSTYCVGTIVKPFEKISNISESFNGRKELKEGLTKNAKDGGATDEQVKQWFDTMIHFEYQCKVIWEHKDEPLEKNSDMWIKLHPHSCGTVRKC